METLKKVPMLGAVLAALVFAGCFQEPTAPQTQAAQGKVPLDPNIALLVASGLPEKDITVSVDPEHDTAYIYEKPVSPADQKKGYAGIRYAYRKKTLDATRRQAAASPEAKTRQNAVYAQPVKLKVPASQAAAANAATEQKASLGKSSQARWDHDVNLWDVKALTEVYNIKVYLMQTGYTKMGPGWIAASREAMAKWNAVTGTHVSFVETTNLNDADLVLKSALFSSGGATVWLTPDPWVEKDSVEIYFNSGFETVFPANQKLGMAMVSLGNILNMLHTNNEGYTWNGGTIVNIAGTPNNESASLFQTPMGPSVNPVFSDWDLKAIRQLYPLNGSTGIDNSNTLWIAGWEANWQIANNVTNFQQAGDTLIWQAGGQLFMRVGTSNTNVLIHSNNQVGSFKVSGSHIVVQRNNGDIYSRTLAGTTSGASWTYKLNVPRNYPAGGDYRLSGNQIAYVSYAPGFPAIYAFNLSNNQHWWEWSGPGGSWVDDFQLQGGRLFIAVNGDVWEKDFWTSNLSQAWGGGSSNPATRIRLSDSHVAIHVWSGGWDGTVYTRPLWGGGWSWAWNEAYDREHFDLCGDKVAVIGQGYYLMLRDLSSGNLYYPWSSINGAAFTVRLSGPMCDYVTKIDQYSGSVLTKYSITNATDYFQYAWGQKSEQRP